MLSIVDRIDKPEAPITSVNDSEGEESLVVAAKNATLTVQTHDAYPSDALG